ncbi:hypothetical protein CF149_09107 [Pseudomonas psychrophila]|jgi:hypothetical protein|nr:hypothetical protein CF149_09107 [Pseudomonas psychrophila]
MQLPISEAGGYIIECRAQIGELKSKTGSLQPCRHRPLATQ